MYAERAYANTVECLPVQFPILERFISVASVGIEAITSSGYRSHLLGEAGTAQNHISL